MDELAKMIGVKPNITKYVLNDPNLARILFFHAASPYQYRLMVRINVNSSFYPFKRTTVVSRARTAGLKLEMLFLRWKKELLTIRELEERKKH